jgi:hypothetical protein
MNAGRRVGRAAHLFLAVIALVEIGCFRSEQPYRHHGTLSAARSAGEVERGWLPSWVPESAVDIHLQGDLDTNWVWIRFRLPPEAIAQLRAGLRRLKNEEVQRLPWRRPNDARTWWPRNLVQLQPADDLALNAELFETQAQPNSAVFIVALERETQLVFAWSVRP